MQPAYASLGLHVRIVAGEEGARAVETLGATRT